MELLAVFVLIIVAVALVKRRTSSKRQDTPEPTVAEILARDRKRPSASPSTKTLSAPPPTKTLSAPPPTKTLSASPSTKTISASPAPVISVVIGSQGQGKRQRVTDSGADAWEGTFWDAIDPLPVKDCLRFEYVDGNGNRTTRTVEIREIGVYGRTHLIIGHCVLRDATRTFRLDRIVSCHDGKTGQLISDVLARLYERYDNDPVRAEERLRETEKDTLKVLFYVGKADGQLRSEEISIIRETAHAMLADSRLTDKAIDKVLRDLGVPSIQAFKLAVGRLAQRSPESRQVIVAAAERMVATQKTIAPAEADALAYMKKRLLNL